MEFSTKIIESYEFKEKLKNEEYQFVIGEKSEKENHSYLEIELPNSDLIAINAELSYKLKVFELIGYYLIYASNEYLFFNKVDSTLVLKDSAQGGILDILKCDEKIVVISQFEIVIYDDGLNLVENVEFMDIITDYKIEDDIISYRLDSGEIGVCEIN